MPLSKDLREFVALLNSNKVEYLVVGAFAVAHHGFPRYTADLDLLIRSTPENAARVLHALPGAYPCGSSGGTRSYETRSRVDGARQRSWGCGRIAETPKWRGPAAQDLLLCIASRSSALRRVWNPLP
jgi:hypothetical protein